MYMQEKGTIKSFYFGKDKECRNFWVAQIDFDFGGAGQSLQLCLRQDELYSFESDVYRLFATKDLVGKECFILRHTESLNEVICGLEYNGNRLTKDGWYKRFHGKERNSLDARAQSIKDEISRLEKLIVKERQSLKDLKSKFVVWKDTL